MHRRPIQMSALLGAPGAPGNSGGAHPVTSLKQVRGMAVIDQLPAGDQGTDAPDTVIGGALSALLCGSNTGGCVFAVALGPNAHEGADGLAVRAWFTPPTPSFRPHGVSLLPSGTHAVVVGTGANAIYSIPVTPALRRALLVAENDVDALRSTRDVASCLGDQGPLRIDGALSASLPAGSGGLEGKDVGYTAVAVNGDFLSVAEARTGLVRCIPLPQIYLSTW